MDGASKPRRTGEVQTVMSLLNQLGSARESGIEHALTELNSARQVVTFANDPEEWAKITMELAELYSIRKEGGKAVNLKSAINCFTEALTVYQAKSHPTEWALCQSQLARAYLDLDLCNGPDPLLKELSLLHCRMALALVTKENSPELWHKIHLDLSVLHKWHALYSGNEDRTLSEEYYRAAFDLDREKHAALYEVLKSMHELYSKLLLLHFEKRETAPSQPERRG